MYLSCLLIDVGSNPDRPRPGRLWLRNVYRVHQRLCMAFPFSATKVKDKAYLKPYDPCGFSPVHVPRDTKHNFLFRVDPQAGGSAVILVLSALEPDWHYAFHNAKYLLAAPPQDPKPMKLDFQVGTHFRFRLAANPVYRAREKSVDRQGQPIDRKWIDGGSAGYDVRADRVVLSESWTSCVHDNYRPGLVLDPFAGTGTSLRVCVE